MTTSPTTIARKPSENRIVESAQIDRQIIRDVQTDVVRSCPGLDDDQNLRFQCIALACQVGPSIRVRASDDPENPGKEYIDVADAFLAYITDGTVA